MPILAKPQHDREPNFTEDSNCTQYWNNTMFRKAVNNNLFEYFLDEIKWQENAVFSTKIIWKKFLDHRKQTNCGWI
jgi:hypothetical protein